MIHTHQKFWNWSKRSINLAVGYSCKVVLWGSSHKLVVHKSACFCQWQAEVIILSIRQHYGNDSYKDKPFCQMIMIFETRNTSLTHGVGSRRRYELLQSCRIHQCKHESKLGGGVWSLPGWTASKNWYPKTADIWQSSWSNNYYSPWTRLGLLVTKRILLLNKKVVICRNLFCNVVRHTEY